MKKLSALTMAALMVAACVIGLKNNACNGMFAPQDCAAAVESDIQFLDPEAEDIHVLERVEETQYYWRFEGNDCVLYASALNGKSPKKLATFPPYDEDNPGAYRNEIVDFGICGDWVIATVGNYQGSGHYFYGDFVRLKKDGSELEHFWLTDADTFIIGGEWIYYDFWTVKGDRPNEEGVYRIRPDGTDKEYMGDKLQFLFSYDPDGGYLYGVHNKEEPIRDWANITDLIRCHPDESESLTLFSGDSLPFFQDSTHMQYSDFEIHDTYLTFTVFVFGYNSDNDSWRGHMDYIADYRIDKNGSNLTLLQEQYPVSHEQE